LIATHLPGRTEGQVKNRYYSSIKKRIETNGAFSQTSATASASEVESSFPTSPESEEAKVDFQFDFDANMMNGTVNTSTYMISKPYSFEEDTYSDETTTQGFVSQSQSPFRPTEVPMLSYETSDKYFFGQPQSDLFHPIIENDNQIDDMLEKVTNYFLDNTGASSDVDSFFSEDLKSPQETMSAEKLSLLTKRKAYLELALAKTLKEIKSF
jgi:hypothetical protein